MKDLKTIILAAGKGTRMKSDVPKVLHKVCGQAIIQYVLDITQAIGSQKTIVVLGHKIQEIRNQLPSDIEIVEQKKLLGTADAVRSAAGHFRSFKGDVLILCGDTPLLTKETVKKLVSKHKRDKAACTFLTGIVHNPQGYGRIIRDHSGKVIAIREDKNASEFERKIAEINAGVYCFKASELFNSLSQVKQNKLKKEFYLTDVVEILTNKKRKVQTVSTDDFTEALGVNSRADLAQSGLVIRKRLLNRLMEQGVSIVDPDTTFIQADVKIGQDTEIRPFTVIEKNVRVGKKCIIGPFARLREGTRIGNFVEVGNFAEVSRTSIGDQSLMKHFGFLGDTTVGKRVNIGAGTVTANYDGINKNKTRIDDEAFIGSDSILVAPVKIGKKAVIGAGSVVVRGNIPDHSKAVGVPARVIKKGNTR
ncbi:MAG: NTP transferase domain-containing protein [Candidatus Omnitrophica bacterium]|nr:NTP transferase domain-containing protein [Candidatus Omnitrophota bacterium]